MTLMKLYGKSRYSTQKDEIQAELGESLATYSRL